MILNSWETSSICIHEGISNRENENSDGDNDRDSVRNQKIIIIDS